MTTYRRSRTLRSFVLRAFVPRLVVLGAVAAALGVGHVLALAAPASSSQVASVDVASQQPVWTVADSAAYPGCVPLSAWPAGRPAAYVVVQGVRAASHRRVAFDAAWRANHDETKGDDVWVLGVCR